MPVLHHQELHDRLLPVLTHAGVEESIADQVIQNLLTASLKGHDSHGITLLPRYISAIEAGELNPAATLRPLQDNGPILSFYGEQGFGQVLGQQAIAAGIDRAKQFGVAIVTLAESHHLGRIGAWAEQAAQAGMASLHFANVSATPAVLPFNGKSPRLGTNPFCAGIPVEGGQPIILDFATSMIAGNKARIAWHEGKPIPPGCAVDDQGNPTTDPRWLMEAPYGALLAFGGHKGAGLSLICSLLGAALSGGKTESHNLPRRPAIINNMLSIIFDPQQLGGSEHYKEEIQSLLDWVRASDDAGNVLLPGEPESRHYQQRVQDGIYIDDKNWHLLTELEKRVTQ